MHKLLAVLSASMVVLPLLAASPLAAQTPGFRIAYLDSRKIVAEAPGAAEAQATFEREMAQFQTELERLEVELDSMIRSYDQRQVMLSTEARQQEQNRIREKQTAFQNRVQQLEQQAAARQAELVEPIMERIESVIEAFRRENNYALILDVSAGSIVAADTTLDVTDQVLARLRATAQNP